MTNQKQKRKMKRNLRILGLIILLPCLQRSYGQPSKSIKDTVFICLVSGTLDNGRPVTEYLLSKDLPSIYGCLKAGDQDSIICRLTEKLILFEEPFLTLKKNRLRYQFNSVEQEAIFSKNYYKRLLPLSKKMTEFSTAKLSNGRHLTLNIAKISGEFWTLPANKTTFSESFPDNGCYKKEYISNLKSIDKIYRLADTERIEILVHTGSSM
jgi:hypothetical protein